MKTTKTMIVGAGLTGLIVANRLRSAQDAEVVVVEKSRGVGGRLATRRTDSAKFDHGAQFYSLKAPLQSWHTWWAENSLVEPWFDRAGFIHFKSPGGMTALAKLLAQDLNLRLATRVVQIFEESDGWRIQFEDQSEEVVDQVILTCPLPQSLEILRRSHIPYDPKLEKILYAKAVVALIETGARSASLTDENGYREFSEGPLFSIADQQKKGLSKAPAFTVTLNPEASETFFDQSDEAAAETVIAELQRIDSGLKVRSVQIKKWRYSHPFSPATSLYSNPAEGLFLSGDAFGGPSLNGAARSAEALADHLLKRNSEAGGFDYRSAILEKLASRSSDKTMCPSEVLLEAQKTNKAMMEDVRHSARLLAEQGKIEITQKGQLVDPANIRGPIRLRMKR